MARKYQLQRRAQRQEETRQRIVEAAVHLHQTVGGSKASISAIAELAGVERLTVYRHFPDERSLVIAYTSHYQAANPPPDPGSWLSIIDAEQRLRRGLTEIYAFHRRTEQMSTHAMRDMEEKPVLREVLAPYFVYWEQVRDGFASAWGTRNAPGAPWIRAAIGHAISFQTWRSLVREQGLEDTEAVELMLSMLRCLCRSKEEFPSSQARAQPQTS